MPDTMVCVKTKTLHKIRWLCSLRMTVCFKAMQKAIIWAVAIENKLDSTDIHLCLWQLTPVMSWNPLSNLVFPVKQDCHLKKLLVNLSLCYNVTKSWIIIFMSLASLGSTKTGSAYTCVPATHQYKRLLILGLKIFGGKKHCIFKRTIE